MPRSKLLRTEKEFLEAMRHRLRETFPTAFLFKSHGGPYGAGGIPDLVGCIRGRFVAIEFKKSGGKVTPRQYAVLSAISLAGGIAAVATPVSLYVFPTEEHDLVTRVRMIHREVTER